MMNRVNDLIPMVIISLKGCPEDVAMYGIRRALSTVCRETGCWRGSISFVAGTIVSDDNGKEVDIPESANAVDASVSKAIAVYIEKMKSAGVYEDKRQIPLHACSIYRGDQNTITFAEFVDIDAGDRVTIDAYLFPSEIGSLLNDFPINVLYQCAECTVHLAVSILASMPERTWSSALLSQTEQFEYRRAKRILLVELGQENMNTFSDSRIIGLVEG
jgi:hypothetical protein